MNKYYLGVLLVVASAIGFSLLPSFAKYAYLYGINVNTLLLIRFISASAVFFCYVFIKIKGFRLHLNDIAALFLLGGICYTLQSTLYFQSLSLIPASLAVLLLYTYPLFVTVITAFLQKKLPDKAAVISVLLSFAGLVLIVGMIPRSISFAGVIYSVAASVVYSFYVVYGNHVVRKLHPMVTSAFVTFFAAAGILATGLFTDTISFAFDIRALIPTTGIALFSTVLSIFTFFKGMELLGATKASILSMLEPPFTVLFAFFMLGEKLAFIQTAGGVFVLAGAVIATIASGRQPVHEANMDI